MAQDAGDLQRHMASGEPQTTPDKIGKVAVLLRDKLRHGPPELRQAYARLVMDEVSVSDEEIRISGSKRGFRLRQFVASGASDMDREEGMDVLSRGAWHIDTCG